MAENEQGNTEQRMYKALVDKPLSTILAYEKVLDALNFYADPMRYFALLLAADPPCGDFVKDFGPIEGEDRNLYETYRKREKLIMVTKHEKR